MITEKEKMVSDENYEISKRIYKLFKKYKIYNKENIVSNSKIEVKNNISKYNYDELFKNRKKHIYQNSNEHAITEIKKENWFIKIIKKIFKMNKFK